MLMHCILSVVFVFVFLFVTQGVDEIRSDPRDPVMVWRENKRREWLV